MSQKEIAQLEKRVRALEEAKESIRASSGHNDPLYDETKQIVVEAGKASTSYIQRRLVVGYSRAARLIDELEDDGIIGPQEGSKPRKVLVSGDSPEDLFTMRVTKAIEEYVTKTGKKDAIGRLLKRVIDGL